MSWSPKGDQQIIVFKKKGQKSKYARMGGSHTSGNLCVIPLGILNRLA